MNIFALYLIISWYSTLLSKAHGREINFGNSITSHRSSLMNDVKFRNLQDSRPKAKNDSLIPRKHLFKRNFRVAKKLLEKYVNSENGIGVSPNYDLRDEKRKRLTMKVAKHLVKVTSALQSKPSNAKNTTDNEFVPVNQKFSHLIEIIPINETEYEAENSELEEFGKEYDLKSAKTENVSDLEKLDGKLNSERNRKQYFASVTSSQLESQDLEIKQLKEGGYEIFVNPKFNHTINISTGKESNGKTKHGGQQSIHTKDIYKINESVKSESETVDKVKTTKTTKTENEFDSNEEKQPENEFDADNVSKTENEFRIDETANSNRDSFDLDEVAMETNSLEATDSNLDTGTDEAPNSEQDTFNTPKAIDNENDFNEDNAVSEKDSFDLDEANSEQDSVDLEKATDSEVGTFSSDVDTDSEHDADETPDSELDSFGEVIESDESINLDETTTSQRDTFSIDEAQNSELELDEDTDSELDNFKDDDEDRNSKTTSFDLEEATDSEQKIIESNESIDLDETITSKQDTFSIDEDQNSELDLDEDTDSELDTLKNDEDLNSERAPFDLVEDSKQEAIESDISIDLDETTTSKQDTFRIDEAQNYEQDLDKATDSELETFKGEDTNSKQAPFDLEEVTDSEQHSVDSEEATDFEFVFDKDNVISKKDPFDFDEATESDELIDFDEATESDELIDFDEATESDESIDFDEATESEESIDFEENSDSKKDHFETEEDPNSKKDSFNTHKTINNKNDFNEDEVIYENNSFDTDEATDSEVELIDSDQVTNSKQDTFDVNESQNSENSTFDTSEVTDSESDTIDFDEAPDSEHSTIQIDENSNFERDTLNSDKISNSEQDTFETTENPNVEPGSFDTDRTINIENINSEKDSFNPNTVINGENNQSIKETSKEILTEDNQQSVFNDDLEGSGEDSFGSDDFENQTVNKSGRLFSGVFARRNATKSNCKTPKGEPGQCRQITQCLLSDALNSFNVFLQHLCLVRGALVGVCCPDNPVIEITDSEANATNSTESDIKQPPEGCGLNTKTRIVGGTVSLPHEWTWMVALQRRGRFFCGGVLINNWYVLTAAHCIMGMNVKDLSVRLGEYDFNTQKEHQEDISISEIKRHAQFVTLTFQHDIALLKLSRSVNYSKFVGSICLPDDKARDFSDAEGTVVGWGTVSFGGAASPVLRQVTVPVWKNEDCDRVYLIENINESFVCAGSPEKGEDACQGDSGGPLMTVNEQGRWEVIGIVSWGRRCGDPTYPGVYTRVTTYKDWIDQNAV